MSNVVFPVVTRYRVTPPAASTLGPPRSVSYTSRDCLVIPDYIVKKHSFYARKLDLSSNQLRSLQGVDHFGLLEELLLDNNELSDDVQFYYNANLLTLSLNKNRFSDLEKLITNIRKYYPKLTYLSLLANPCCPDQLTSGSEYDEDDYQRYRLYVISQLPFLNFLDFRIVTTAERREAMRIGSFSRIVRPSPDTIDNANINRCQPQILAPSPLPQTSRSPTLPRNAYGVLRYRYTGKHSEGNRFISNDQL